MNNFFIALSVVGILVFGFVGMYISANNEGVYMEKQIEAIQTNTKNIAANYQNLVFEAAQVPEMQRDDLKEVVTAALSGRYGEDGSKAIFQAIAEDNPTIDSTVYIKIQQIMESGRTDFKREQTRLIDAVAVYKTKLGQMPKSFFFNLAGYPKINFEDFKIVTTDRVESMFETGKEEFLKLRP